LKAETYFILEGAFPLFSDISAKELGRDMEQTDEITRRLMDGNELFRKALDPILLRKLAARHEPLVAILSCSDARVDPAKAFNLALGSAFVVRSAGNSAADPSILGSLEYAASHLGAKAIVVLGHTDCGAVKQSFDCTGCEPLQVVMKDIEAAKSTLQGLDAKDTVKVAEANVRLQLRRLSDNSSVIRHEVNEGKLLLLGAMMDLSTGAVWFI